MSSAKSRGTRKTTKKSTTHAGQAPPIEPPDDAPEEGSIRALLTRLERALKDLSMIGNIASFESELGEGGTIRLLAKVKGTRLASDSVAINSHDLTIICNLLEFLISIHGTVRRLLSDQTNYLVSLQERAVKIHCRISVYSEYIDYDRAARDFSKRNAHNPDRQAQGHHYRFKNNQSGWKELEAFLAHDERIYRNNHPQNLSIILFTQLTLGFFWHDKGAHTSAVVAELFEGLFACFVTIWGCVRII